MVWQKLGRKYCKQVACQFEKIVIREAFTEESLLQLNDKTAFLIRFWTDWRDGFQGLQSLVLKISLLIQHTHRLPKTYLFENCKRTLLVSKASAQPMVD